MWAHLSVLMTSTACMRNAVGMITTKAGIGSRPITDRCYRASFGNRRCVWQRSFFSALRATTTDQGMGDHDTDSQQAQELSDTGNAALIAVKALASNDCVGAIIGRNGASIAEIQQGSDTKINISTPGQEYPGTNERVMVISGEMVKVMQKWKTEEVFRDHLDIGPDHVQLRLVMLSKLCGAIIGEGGRAIKEIMQATNTSIRVQAREECLRGVSERIVTIVGGENAVLQAVGRILHRVLADPEYEDYQQQLLVPSSAQDVVLGGKNAKLHYDEPAAQVPCHFTMDINSNQAGAVLGLRGANIASINRASNARVQIQPRDEVQEGELRKLTIEGDLAGSMIVLDLVVRKLREAALPPIRGTPRGHRDSY